jgi:hypothetical protein
MVARGEGGEALFLEMSQVKAVYGHWLTLKFQGEALFLEMSQVKGDPGGHKGPPLRMVMGCFFGAMHCARQEC